VSEPDGHPLDSLVAHRAWVRSVARALSVDVDDADDMEQETWLAALSRPSRQAGARRGRLGAATRNVPK
jgi:DNA-directed RNA polymerase specialized sigma24 family protein